MPRPDALPPTWAEGEVFWSTVGYLRSWWSTDCANLRMVQDRREIVVRDIEIIGREYSILRSFDIKDGSRAAMTDERTGKTHNTKRILCDLLMRRTTDWPDKLVERAKRCEEIAEEARDLRITTLGRSNSGAERTP
jgi:hypothetical protein